MIWRYSFNFYYEVPNSEFIQKFMFFLNIPTCLQIKTIKVLISTSSFSQSLSLKPF